MNRRLKAFALGAFLLLCAASLSAQNVFVTPPPSGFSSNTTVFTADPFAQAAVFSANVAATQVLTADGLKFYIVSANGTNTVMAVDSTFTNVRSIASLGSNATASLISPNGQRLVVATATIQIFDTATDTQLAAGINVGGSVSDMAMNLESTRIFALVTPNVGFGGPILVAIDLASGSILGSIGNLGFATGVTTGPNDLLYVTTQNAIFEIDPRTVAVRQTIAIVGKAGKMAVTPDGRLGVMANQTPVTGSALITLDLNSRAVGAAVPTASLPANVILDKIFPIAPTRVLALSTGTNFGTASLFDISLNPVSVSNFAFSTAGSLSAVATTSDIATPVHPVTRFVFLLSGSTLTRVDLSANQVSGQLPLSNPGGGISVDTAPVTATPATMLTFGDNQSVVQGGTTLPLVVRMLDAMGRPLRGVTVTFSTTTLGVTLTTTAVNTTNDGFAVTSAIVPNTIGPFNVLAQAAGGLNTSFTVNVGVVNGGVTGGLFIVSGQGQIVLEQSSSQPLTVLLKDVNGNPVPFANVTFTLTQGNGTITGGVSQVTNTTVVSTDANGLASIGFLAGTFICTGGPMCTPTFPSFQSGVITASTDAGASVTFFITTVPIRTDFPATTLLLKPAVGDTLSGQAGTTLKGAVQVLVFSGSGVAIPNVAVSFDPTVSPGVSCAGTFALTNSNGLAVCDLVFGAVGTSQAFVNVGNFRSIGPITIVTSPGPPSKISIVQGDKQSGKPGDRLPQALIVQVTDSLGNLLVGVPVSFTVVTPGSLTLVNVINNTDFNGRAGASVILGNMGGSFQITAAVANKITATFTETVLIPAAGLRLVSGDGQSAVINTSFTSPLIVKVVDANGNGFAGAQVNFAIASGNATFIGSSSPATDANGLAQVSIQAGGIAGNVTVTASFAGFSVTFNLSVRLPGPTNIKFFNGASFVQNVVSPGAIVTITGNGILTGVQGFFAAFNILGPLPTTFPIPANLGTGSILFNGIPCPVFYVSNISGVETVTIQVPFETQVGQANVTINAVSGIPAQVAVAVQQVGPGVFTTQDGSQTIAVAQRQDGSYVSSKNPAHRKDRLTFYVTGLGQVSPAAATGSAGAANQNVVASLIVGLNNAGVPLVSAQYAPGLVGVYTVTLDVPADAAVGPAQPFGLIAMDSFGNQAFAQATFIPISQ